MSATINASIMAHRSAADAVASSPAKKTRRDELYPVAAAALEKLAKDNGCTSGQWLFFPALANVDAVWEKIARSVIETDGALRGKVYTAKVATYQPGSEVSGAESCEGFAR